MATWPSKDPEYLTRVAKLHAWPGQGFDELYDNIEFDELDEENPRTDWLIDKTIQQKEVKGGNAKAKNSKSKDRQ